MAKLKERDGKLIVTSGGKVAKECELGCIVTLHGFGAGCIGSCPALSTIVDVPFLVPPATCLFVGTSCYRVFDPTPVNCGFQSYNYVYINVVVGVSPPLELFVNLAQTQQNPPAGTFFQIFYGQATLADPQTITSHSVCAPGTTATVDFL